MLVKKKKKAASRQHITGNREAFILVISKTQIHRIVFGIYENQITAISLVMNEVVFTYWIERALRFLV